MIIDPISQMKYRDWTWKYVWVYPVWNWRRQWHPTQVLLPGKSHGRRSLVGCSPWGREESDTTERLQFHFSLSCIGEENGNPLQCSCLENPRVGGAWWAAIYGVAQSQRRLKRLSSSSSVKWNEGGASYVRNVVIPRASEWWDLSRERDNLSNFKISDQIRSVAQSCPTLCNPMNAARPASLSITNFQSSPRLTSIESVMPSSHLILCRPLLFLPPIPPSIRVFSNESTLYMRWPKYWSFSFSIIPSKEIPGLISRMAIKQIGSLQISSWLWNIEKVFGSNLVKG